MGRWGARIKDEFIHILPVWLFFSVSFLVVLLYKSLLYAEYGIQISGLYKALIGGAIVSKVFLIVDHLRIVDRYKHLPLIYSILWKTAIYLIAALLVQYLESFVSELLQHISVVVANRDFLSEAADPKFWGVQLWLLVLFFVFIWSRELIGAIGKDRFRQIMFGKQK